MKHHELYKDLLPNISGNIKKEDFDEIKDDINEELDTLDGWLDSFGMDMKFFVQRLHESFNNLKPGSTENRLHLDLLAKIRAFYKQNETKVENVTYTWGEDKQK